MQITIDLPPPGEENIEEKLAEQFGHLVSVCKSVLSGYKKNYNISVPAISIRMPKAAKTDTQKSECTEFINELIAFHLERVPTANVPAQRKVLKLMFESGHTDKEELLKLYADSLREWPDTSWFTVKYKLNNPTSTKVEKATSDMSFQRAELTDAARQSLEDRLKNYSKTSE